MVIRQEVTAPSPNIVQHFFHSLFNTVTCYLEKFRILHFWIQTAQLPNCFVYFYTFHTGVRNCVSSYCLESKLTYNIQHTVTPTGMETCKNYAKKCKPYKRRVSEMSASNNIFCSTWKGLQFTAQPEDFILLLQVCLYFICSLPFALSLSLSGRFWGDDSWRGKGSNLQGVHPLAGQGVMAPAAGDSSQWPTAGPPWLSSSPGCGHASPGLYEVEYIKVSLIGS